MIHRLLSFAVLISVSARAELRAPELNPTRTLWCESVLIATERAPTPHAKLIRATSAAEDVARGLIASVDARRVEMPLPAEIALSEPHRRRVAANLDTRTEGELDRHVRLSRGRLAQLRLDLEHPGATAGGRIDVGSDDILALLDGVPRTARRSYRARSRQPDVVPINPVYALRSLATVGGLGAVTFASALTALHLDDPSFKQTALFLSVAGLSAMDFFDAIRTYGKQFTSPEIRIALENTYNSQRIDEELTAFARLRAMAQRPEYTPRLFAHHGYALFVSERNKHALFMANGTVDVHPERPLWGRAPVALLVDHVLYPGDNGLPTLLTTWRVVDAATAPRAE